jgi:phage terminase large subunit-like protein
MELIAELPDDEREAALRDLDPEQLKWDWSVWGRPEQTPPRDNSWDIGLALAGRGFGKTRMAAEWIRERAKDTSQGRLRFLLVARTAADVREVLVEGESGIMEISPPSERPNYQPSIRRLTWPNGNQAFCTSADEPDSLRGVQAHYSWGDEIAAWRLSPDGAGMTAWDNLRFATRLGKKPQILATTTPKRVDLLYSLIKEHEEHGNIWLTRGSSFDNSANMAPGYLQTLHNKYPDGTYQSKQELYGEMLDAVDGALWYDEMLEDGRLPMAPRGLPLRVIGVDPTVAEQPGDECGIVVCSSTGEHDLYKREAYVLEDASIKASPQVWASAVVRMARKWGCPVVAEVNQGGAMVRNAINAIDPTITVIEVHARVGKQLRAEPIQLAYEQGRVHHVGTQEKLEKQMTSWMPGENKSPDRVDALVHALTALLISPPPGFGGGSLVARASTGRLPIFKSTARAKMTSPGVKNFRVGGFDRR